MIKLTRDEVLKRFEFDVSVGRLTQVSNKINHIICPFDLDESEDLLMIMKVFNKLKFEKTYNPYVNHKNADGISIDLTNKSYWFYTNDPGDERVFNVIPEYLIEYMEQPKNEEE